MFALPSRSNLPSICLTIALLLFVCGAHAQVLVAKWDAFNTTLASYPRPAHDQSSRITTAEMAAPSNLSAVDASSFQLRDWETASTVNPNNYFQANLTVQDGFSLAFNSVKFSGRQSQAGLTMHVRSSADNYAADLGSFALTGSTAVYSVNLASLSAVTGTIGFRFYGTDGVANPGAVVLIGANDTATSTVPGEGFVGFDGTFTAVPEPAAYTMLFGLTALATVAVLRKGHSI